MNLHRNIAIGIVMVVLSITIPVLLNPFHINWWAGSIITVFCWVLSWFGSVRATKGWVRLRMTVYVIERDDALATMDQGYQLKEPQ